MKVKCSRRVRNYRIFLWVLLCGCIMTIALIMLFDIYQSVPDTIYLKSGEETRLSFSVPLSGTIRLREQTNGTYSEAAEHGTDQEVLSGDARAAGMETDQEVLSDDIRVDFSDEVRLTAEIENKYYVNLKLFGIIPFKTVNIDVIRDSMVYPAGVPIGIYVKTNGILVIGVSGFQNQSGDPVMPSEHLLQVGDYIQAVNGEQIDQKSNFVSLVAESDGKPLVMTIERDGETFDVGVKPQKDETGAYKLGIWVKDSAQGIGTLTYVDTNGSFGALGHGVSDTDTGIMLEMSEGALYRTDIIGITKGLSGTPGELTGVIRYTESNRIGVISDNQAVGIHGSAGTALLGELTASQWKSGSSRR